MPKKILLIENDSALAGTLTESLEAAGFDVRTASEGKSGLDLAREWSPDGIVLCVELPGMSGYLVCQKLRKDEATKEIPLVLVSAEATEDTFEKHKALKVRADAYLLKPFVPADLLQKLAEAGLPGELDDAPNTTDELSLEPADEGLELDPGGAVPSLELDALAEDEPPAPAAARAATPDDDLAFLDEAFDGLAAPAGPAGRASPAEELPAAEPSLDAEEAAGPTSMGDLALDEEDPLAELGDEPPAPVRAPSADVLRAAGIPLLDEPPARSGARPTLAGVAATTLRMPAAAPPPPRPPPETGASERIQRELAEARSTLAAREAELQQLRERAEDAAQRADASESAAAEHEAELASLKARLDAVTAQARKAEGELKTAREEARRATGELETLRSRLADAERRLSESAAAAERVEELERELESARTEIIVARGEAEGARSEVDARSAELAKRVAELEAQSAKNEERVFKAYQKIKSDEKVRDKVRKAIAIAAQLLDEGLPAEPAAAPEKSSKVS
ncbi:MAG TPA: response regulator [Anaeromyxobacter sp.]|nr:response regulator [Anaeromyxobacter sp.]